MASPQSKHRWVLFIQTNGPGSQLLPLYDLTDYTIGGMSLSARTLTRIAGTNPDGSFSLKYDQIDPPEALSEFTVEQYRNSSLSPLEMARRDGKSVKMQARYLPCGIITNPLNTPTEIIHIDGDVSNAELADTRTLVPVGELAMETYTVTPRYNIRIFESDVLPLPTASSDVITAVDGIDALDRTIGFVPYAGTDTGAILYSADYGKTFASVAVEPFATGGIAALVISQTDQTKYRVIVGSDNDSVIAFGDVEFGAEGSIAWTTVNLGVTGVVSDLLVTDYGYLYVSVGSKLFESNDRGVSFVEIYDAGQTINALVESPQSHVWAVGNVGVLLRQEKPNGGFFVAVSPTSNDNTVIDVANDGTVLVGDRTGKLYRSRNEAKNAGGWSTISQAFGSEIVFAKFVESRDSGGGDAELIHAASYSGGVWFSESGGANFREIDSASTGLRCGKYVHEHLSLLGGLAGGLYQLTPTG